MRTVSFKTVGCRLNQAETTELASSFAEIGFTVEPFGNATDVVVIHTCAVTAKAEKDCIRIARVCGRRSQKPFIVLAGCAAEVSAPLLQSECAPDLIVGQADKFNLPQQLADIFKVVPTDHKRTSDVPAKTRASVKIQTGCDFHCTYCIVPSARGVPTSRSESDITTEVQSLAQQGFKEVILTGANLGCFGDTDSSLVRLIASIESTEGIERIRLSSIEITTAERRLVDHMTASEKVCRHLHIPLQSGSDSVLRRMNRKYSSADYRAFCDYALGKLPNLALGMDVIVGFPGETDAEFNDTVKLIEEIPFSNIHVFQYSKRSGTPAATMDSQILSSEKKARSDLLLDIAKQKKADFAESMVNRHCSVLIEKLAPDGIASGWTDQYIWAEISSQRPKRNEIVDFTPTQAIGGVLLEK